MASGMLLVKQAEKSLSNVTSVENVVGDSAKTLPSGPGWVQIPLTSTCQVCVTEVEGTKNLSRQRTRQKQAAGATKLSEEKIRGALVNFSWYMKKNGYKEATITSYAGKIKTLVNSGADLWNPDHVKRVVAGMSTWKDSTKKCNCDAYDLFVKMENLKWEKPRYKPEQTLPFIPTEKEIDQLTMGCGMKMRAFLKGLKETGADPGELLAVEWEDIDFTRNKITINHPVKGHNPRILNVSDEWLRMVSRLPRTAKRVWTAKPQSHYNSFKAQRRRRAKEYGNPRLERITFRTLRHWKGTTEYHRTHDIMYVKELLGHKRLTSTQIYIHLEEKLFQQLKNEFIVRRTVSIKGMMALAAVGFEKFDEVDGVHLYRKPRPSEETFSFAQNRRVLREDK